MLSRRAEKSRVLPSVSGEKHAVNSTTGAKHTVFKSNRNSQGGKKEKEVNQDSTMGIINTCAIYMMLVLVSAKAKVMLPLPPCTMQERSLLFNKCLFNFGLAHFPDLALMRNSQTCLQDKLQCSAARDVVVCLNNMKPNAVRNTCRQGLIPTLDYMLTEYNFNCLFKDLETKCWAAIPMLNITAW